MFLALVPKISQPVWPGLAKFQNSLAIFVRVFFVQYWTEFEPRHFFKFYDIGQMFITVSVTRLGNLLDFG